MRNEERINYDVAQLAERIKHPENDCLLSYTERILVALASHDHKRAPGHLKHQSNYEAYLVAAKAELDDHQLAVWKRFAEVTVNDRMDHVQAVKPEHRILKDLDSIAESGIPTEQKRKILFDISQAVGYFMERFV